MWYLERKNKQEFNIQYTDITIDKPKKMVIEYIRGPYENYDENGNP
jgi:hypothetical protein